MTTPAAREAGRMPSGAVGTALWETLQTRGGHLEGVGQPPKFSDAPSMVQFAL